VTVYLPVWFGFGPDQPTDETTGLLVRTCSLGEFRHRREVIRQWKSDLGRRTEAGDITPEVAREKLRSRLSRRRWIALEAADSEHT
jgi:hypothetical protein